MKITLCGSMSFAEEMKAIAQELASMGHEVFMPEPTEGGYGKRDEASSVQRKVELDLIRRHWEKIRISDAILVLNMKKNGVANYIGGNSFLEMGFAHVLNKEIFLLNDVPDVSYRAEMVAMQPSCLRGDLKRLEAGLTAKQSQQGEHNEGDEHGA